MYTDLYNTILKRISINVKHILNESFFDDKEEIEADDNMSTPLKQAQLMQLNEILANELSEHSSELYGVFIEGDELVTYSTTNTEYIYSRTNDINTYYNVPLKLHSADAINLFFLYCKSININKIAADIELNISRVYNNSSKGKEEMKTKIIDPFEIYAYAFKANKLTFKSCKIHICPEEFIHNKHKRKDTVYSYDLLLNTCKFLSDDNILEGANRIYLNVEGLKDLRCVYNSKSIELYVYFDNEIPDSLSCNDNGYKKLEYHFQNPGSVNNISSYKNIKQHLINFKGIPNDLELFKFYSLLSPRLILNNITFEGFPIELLKRSYFKFSYIGPVSTSKNYTFHFGLFKTTISRRELELEYGEKNPNKYMKMLILNLLNNDYYIAYYKTDKGPTEWYENLTPYTGTLDTKTEQEKTKKLEQDDTYKKVVDICLQRLLTKDPENVLQNNKFIKGLFWSDRERKIKSVLQTPIYLCAHKLVRNKWVNAPEKGVIYLNTLRWSTMNSNHLHPSGWLFTGNCGKDIWNSYINNIPMLTPQELHKKYEYGKDFNYLPALNSFCRLLLKNNMLEEFLNTPELKPKKLKTEKETKKVDFNIVTVKPKTNIDIIDYSERSIVVKGDTYTISSKLKELGGHWNKFLTINGKKEAGWVFPKSKKDKVEELLKNI